MLTETAAAAVSPLLAAWEGRGREERDGGGGERGEDCRSGKEWRIEEERGCRWDAAGGGGRVVNRRDRSGRGREQGSKLRSLGLGARSPSLPSCPHGGRERQLLACSIQI